MIMGITMIMVGCSNSPQDASVDAGEASTLGETCERVCGPIATRDGPVAAQCWQYHTTNLRTKDLYHTCVLDCDPRALQDSGAACTELAGHGCLLDAAGWNLCSP
jgi:hypothetical protein